MEEREILYKELTDLLTAMSSSAEGSKFGDWRMVRAYEYAMVGKELDPEEAEYLRGEYHETRERYRARIKEIIELLKTIDE